LTDLYASASTNDRASTNCACRTAEASICCSISRREAGPAGGGDPAYGNAQEAVEASRTAPSTSSSKPSNCRCCASWWTRSEAAQPDRPRRAGGRRTDRQGPTGIDELRDMASAGAQPGAVHSPGVPAPERSGGAHLSNAAAREARRPSGRVELRRHFHGADGKRVLRPSARQLHGASSDKIGDVQDDEGGTMLLDESATGKLNMQSSAARAQERAVRPVGGEPRFGQRRVISATNQDGRCWPRAASASGPVYRLNVIEIRQAEEAKREQKRK